MLFRSVNFPSWKYPIQMSIIDINEIRENKAKAKLEKAQTVEAEKEDHTTKENLDSGKGQATLEKVEDSEEDMDIESPIKRVVEIVPTELFQYVGPISKPGDTKRVKKANSQVRFNKTELTAEEAQTIAKVWNSWSEPKRKSVVSEIGRAHV